MATAKALLVLLAGIVVELVATSSLPRTNGFRQPHWTALVLGGYGISLWLLAIATRTLPVSTTYALWSGLGTAAIAVVGRLWLDESLGPVKVAGLLMIVTGVVLVNLQSVD